MDEEIEIINNNTRTEKIKNFLINFKKQVIAFVIIIKKIFNFFNSCVLINDFYIFRHC